MSDAPIKEGEVRCPEFYVMFRYCVFSHHLDFKAKQYTPQPDGSGVFYDIENQLYPRNFDEGERFVDGSVKWDGCSHYYFGDKDGYIHLCGADNFNALAWVLRETFLTASREIPRFDPDIAALSRLRATPDATQQENVKREI